METLLLTLFTDHGFDFTFSGFAEFLELCGLIVEKKFRVNRIIELPTFLKLALFSSFSSFLKDKIEFLQQDSNS